MMTDEEIMKKFEKYFSLEANRWGGFPYYTVVNGKIVTDDVVKMKRDNLSNLPVHFDKTGDFNCTLNKLESLKGCPDIVDGFFYCSQNQLENLLDGPQQVYGDYACDRNPLKSLKGLPHIVTGDFFLSYDAKLPMLPLLKIKSVRQILFFNGSRGFTDVNLGNILSKYCGTGTQGMLSCSMEMIKAGYGSNARL